MKFLKIKGSGCYVINVTFISFPKVDLVKFAKFEFWHVSSVPAFEKIWYSFR